MASEQLMFGLSPKIVADIQAVFAQYPQIEKVLLFGSRAKNTWKDGSDIDLAVISATLSDHDFTMLWNQVEDLPLVFKIDCLHWDRLTNSDLKNKILREGEMFYSADL